MSVASVLLPWLDMLQLKPESTPGLESALEAMARSTELGYQLASFAVEQGDLEAAAHFERLASETEQRLRRLSARLPVGSGRAD